MLGYRVYMLARRRNGALYVGVTSNLVRRVAEHRERTAPGFTEKYGVTRHVWFERHDSIEAAIRREKRLKKWPRTAAAPPGEATRMRWMARSSRPMTGWGTGRLARSLRRPPGSLSLPAGLPCHFPPSPLVLPRPSLFLVLAGQTLCHRRARLFCHRPARPGDPAQGGDARPLAGPVKLGHDNKKV
jgi:putative endonuclease